MAESAMIIRFSDRIGATRRPILHMQEVPNILRVALWNVLQPSLFASRPHHLDWRPRLVEIYEYQHRLVHTLSYQENHETLQLHGYFFNAALNWYDVYNFVELVASVVAKRFTNPTPLYQKLNQVLEDEGSPYRFLEGMLTPIGDESSLRPRARAYCSANAGVKRRATQPNKNLKFREGIAEPRKVDDLHLHETQDDSSASAKPTCGVRSASALDPKASLANGRYRASPFRSRKALAEIKCKSIGTALRSASIDIDSVFTLRVSFERRRRTTYVAQGNPGSGREWLESRAQL